jgi:hypothetical protein
MPGFCASKEACSIASIVPKKLLLEHQSSNADIEIQNRNRAGGKRPEFPCVSEACLN